MTDTIPDLRGDLTEAQDDDARRDDGKEME